MNGNQHKFPKNIYDMKLNEEMIAEPMTDKSASGTEFECLSLRILRVPGGWVYYNAYATSGGVFVPFVKEDVDEV